MWFKVDDRLYDHPKVHRLGRGKLAALGLWTLCGAWACAYETDGFVPRAVVKQLAGDYRTAARLVSCGLWAEAEREGDRGYAFVDWEQWQPSRAAMTNLRRSRAEAGRLGGIKSGESRRSKAEANASEDGSSKSNPVPSRPDRIATDVAIRGPRERGTTTTGTRIPEQFDVTPEMVAWAHEHAPHVDGRAETARFVDYWRAKTGKDATKRDWPATWRNWMRTAEERADRRTNGHQRRPTADDKIAQLQAMKVRGGPALPPGSGS